MSYTSQQFLIADNSSDANFRSWGSAISAAIASMGWTKTSDTSGQVDWGSVNSPASGSFVWEVWTPGDAKTAFKLKVEYGSSSGATKGVRLRMSIGATSNGSGTLTGLLSAVYEPGTTNGVGQGSTPYDCYFSGDTNRLSMLLWRSLNGQGMPIIFSVERTHDTDGADNNDGVTIVAGGSSSGGASGQQTVVFGVATGNGSNTRCYVALTNGQNASDAFNNNIPISPAFPSYGKYGNPMTTIAFAHSQEVGEGCFFTTTLYGSTRTYIATGLISVTVPASCKICMRYD